MPADIRPATFLKSLLYMAGSSPWTNIDALMRGLGVERAHLVGLSMGGYAALQFGLRYPERVSAIVSAGVGAGSAPSQRDAWLRETSVLARAFSARGMDAMADGARSDSHSAQMQGRQALARVHGTPAASFPARNIEDDGALSGVAATVT